MLPSCATTPLGARRVHVLLLGQAFPGRAAWEQRGATWSGSQRLTHIHAPTSPYPSHSSLRVSYASARSWPAARYTGPPRLAVTSPQATATAHVSMALPGPLTRRDPVRACRAVVSVTVLLACLLALPPATASPALHAAATPSLFARQDDSGSSSDASLLPT